MRKEMFINGQCYHVYNRGVEKRDIFISDRDKDKFLTNLKILNNAKSTYLHLRPSSRNPVSTYWLDEDVEPYVKVMCYALMSNHYHLVLEQLADNGISRFMHKLSVSYAKYFNIKYERVGPLFQGRYKTKVIESEGYLMDITRYIHINPIVHRLEQGGLNWFQTQELLRTNKDTSYSHFMNEQIYSGTAKNSIIDLGMLKDYFHSPEEYEEFIKHRMTERFDELSEWTSCF